MDIGIRLQAVRKGKGLSQRELAKRVGVTNSTISLIEQNKVSPSISSLKKVLDGIPISLADFFTLELGDTGDSPFYPADEQPDLGNNEIHYFLVGHRRRNRQMCVLREVMPPGSDTGESMIQHEGEEGGVSGQSGQSGHPVRFGEFGIDAQKQSIVAFRGRRTDRGRARKMPATARRSRNRKWERACGF